MAIKRAALSQFIFLCNCLLLQISLCFAQTHTYSSNLYLGSSVRLCLSLHLVPHSSLLNPTVPFPLLLLDTLLLVSPFTGSHLCTTDTLINPGFVLLQKGVGCPSGSTLIAVWEHRPGLLSTCLFSPLLYFSLVILSSLSLIHWPSITSAPLLNTSYIPLIFTYFPSSLFSYPDILFLPFSPSLLPSPAVPHFTLMQTTHSGPNLNIIR